VIRLVVFLAALLLFLVQPMVARQVLPALGGSAAVWTTCVAFFQLTLLAGYLYAHALAAWIPPRAGAALHDPTPWLLGALARGVGPCFLALAATTPLVQSWLARSTLPGARDPYFLFAASNLGSLAALVAYPILMEPWLTLPDQASTWSAGFLALAAGLVAAAAVTLRRLAAGAEHDPRAEAPEVPALPPDEHAPATPPSRLRWLVLSFVPSSLMLGVTAHIANEVPALSLLWVTPLALYLLTFAMVFARRPPIPHAWVVAAHPPLLCLLAVVLYVPTRLAGFVIHLGAFVVSGLLLHGELARSRPEPRRLTEFYLWIATGGALAGLFHALVAPHIFSTAAEYPLAILAAAALQPDDLEVAPPEASAEDEAARLLAFALDEEEGAPEPAAPPPPPAPRPASLREAAGPVAMGVGLVVLLQVIPWFADFRDTFIRVGLLLVAGMTANYLRGRRLRFTLALAAVIAGGLTGIRLHGVVTTARSPHGVHRVTLDARSGRTRLYHGSTVHGVELPDHRPSSYYHPDTPIGRLLTRARTRARRLGCIGLGAGSLAWFTSAGQHLTVYELDPVVARLAGDPRYFTLLEKAAGRVDVVLGDGRRRLTAAADDEFDFLLLDAFSSDAVPVHLLTREALELYRRKLAPGGLLVLHTSNRHLRLERPAVAGLAALGLPARIRRPRPATDLQRVEGMAVATWVVAAHRTEDLEDWLGEDSTWEVPVPGDDLWTDARASVLPLLAW
jgi:spermidine synthase